MNPQYKESKEGIIYKYTSPSKKQYIGQTWYEERRKWQHAKAYGDAPIFHEAIKKYGYENFQYEVLHKGIKTQEEMDQLEMQEIAKYGTISPNGYNMSSGGSSGKMCEEARKKLSDSRKGIVFTEEHRNKLRMAKLGGHHTPEHIEKQRLSSKGKIVPPEVGAKISAKLKGRPQRPEVVERRRLYLTGKPRSKEVMEHLHNCVRGRKHTPQSLRNMSLAKRRYIKCVELNLIFDWVGTAVAILGGNPDSIKMAASGKTKTSGGYHWEYMD